MSEKCFPPVEKIRGFYRRGYVVPLARTLPFTDPFQVFRKFYGRGPALFLDSARFHRNTATHSFLCLNPFHSFEFNQGHNPFERLRKLCARWKGRRWPEFPHFTGGAVGFLSYDLFRDLEKVRTRAGTAAQLPRILLQFVRDVIVFDHAAGRMKVIANLIPGMDGTFDEARRSAIGRLDAMTAVMRSALRPEDNHPHVRKFHSNLSRRQFEQMVVRAKEYIRAGDIYQANLSQRFGFDYSGGALSIYQRLRKINPSPFSSFLDFGRLKILSCSPERLVRLRGRECETRPIAGTRPAGRTRRESADLSAELLLNEKERAEHLMLLDLERNDLGRVCQYHSVRVSEMMTLEKYSHVMHIVSNVSGRLGAGKDGFDLLKSVFPGGTITGCPKIRCMEIIDELEASPRGLYTGSIGYRDFNGDMDWNIVIRTIVLNDRRGELQVGAGIVHDSVPAKEYEETLHKARALMEALELQHV